MGEVKEAWIYGTMVLVCLLVGMAYWMASVSDENALIKATGGSSSSVEKAGEVPQP